MFTRIDEVSQESSPNGNCTRNLLELFEKSAKGKPTRNTLDEFTKELEQNLQCIDNKDVAGLESHRDTQRQPSRHRSSAAKTNLSELEESMIKDEETRLFMEAMFPEFETNDRPIPLKQFLSKAIVYFFPDEQLTKEEMQLLRKKCKKLLTTTDEGRLSMNALSVVTKSSSIRILLLEQTIRVREELQHELKTQEQEIILNEMANIERELKNERELLNKKAKQLHGREQAVNVREKIVLTRQRDLKALLQKQYEKCLEKAQKAIQQSVVEVDRKTSLIERNIKYKIQLLDKRIEDYQKVQLTERQVDTKLKQKCIRLEKQNQVVKDKCIDAERIAATFLEEKQGLVKKIVTLEEKVTKLSGRVTSLKEDLAAANRKGQEAVLRYEQSGKELATIKEQNQRYKQEKQREQLPQKRQLDQEPAVLLLSCFIATAQKTIPKIITFYREQPERELDFELAEVFYEKSLDVLQLHQELFSQATGDKLSQGVLAEHSPIVRFMVQLSLFTLNCNYAREKEQLLPRLESIETPSKAKRSVDRKYQLFANDKIAGKIIKGSKKVFGKETADYRLIVDYSLWSLLLSETDAHVQNSVAALLKTVLNSHEAKQYLMGYECFTCILLKSTSVNNSDDTLSHLLDLLLEYCSSDSLSDTLLKLEEFENYQLLLSLIPRLEGNAELLERLSIVLQRYSYVYKKDMVLSSHISKTLRDIIHNHQSDKQSLIAANFTAVLESSL